MTSFRRFTGLQYYLAHARNSVHALFVLPQVVTQDAFMTLVGNVIASAPQVLWRESLQDGGHHRDTDGDWAAQCVYLTYDDAAAAAKDLSKRLAAPLHDTGCPAFRAICQTVSYPEGPRSKITFQTTHALMEGGDVADLLRGRDALRANRPTVAAKIPLLARLGVWLVVPLLWLVNLSMAAFEKTNRSDFDMARIIVNRADLRKAATRIGISQRDLAFALTTHHRNPGKKGVFVTYANRPVAQVLLCDDEYLSVRMDEVRIRLAPDFNVYAEGLAETLRRRGPSPLFTQMWYRRITQVHRWLHPRAPWLYPKRLFGFAPYDVVLSFLPPVRVGRAFAALKDAQIFTGSDTGTAESCIYAMGAQEMTISLWSGTERGAHVDAILARATSLGIAAERSA